MIPSGKLIGNHYSIDIGPKCVNQGPISQKLRSMLSLISMWFYHWNQSDKTKVFVKQAPDGGNRLDEVLNKYQCWNHNKTFLFIIIFFTDFKMNQLHHGLSDTTHIIVLLASVLCVAFVAQITSDDLKDVTSSSSSCPRHCECFTVSYSSPPQNRQIQQYMDQYGWEEGAKVVGCWGRGKIPQNVSPGKQNLFFFFQISFTVVLLNRQYVFEIVTHYISYYTVHTWSP